MHTKGPWSHEAVPGMGQGRPGGGHFRLGCGRPVPSLPATGRAPTEQCHWEFIDEDKNGPLLALLQKPHRLPLVCGTTRNMSSGLLGLPPFCGTTRGVVRGLSPRNLHPYPSSL